MAKNKMSIETKNKLIYSGEMIGIAIAFLVIATLEILNIIGKNQTMLVIFNWVTIFGGAIMIGDFIFVLVSPWRRKRTSLLDKVLSLPLAVFLITFDILCFASLNFVDLNFRHLMMGIAFYYIAVIYVFEGIYHYKHPIPLIQTAIDEEEGVAKAKAEKLAEVKTEENKEEKDGE